MPKRILRSVTTIVMLTLLFTSLGVSPTFAAGSPPPPPPPPGVAVDRQSATAQKSSGSPIRVGAQASLKAGKFNADVNALAGTVSTYRALTSDSYWNYKTSFAAGETIRYVGWVYNGTGYGQNIYAWWQLSTPCWSGFLQEGWLYAPVGYPGWYLQSAAACPGAQSFTFWTWYNGVYTSSTASFTVRSTTPVTYTICSNLKNRAYVGGLTGPQVDSAMHLIRPTNNGLYGYGQVFVDTARQLGLNPLYIAAHAAWQSGWGTSAVWLYKNNPFSYGPSGGCPYSCAVTYPSKTQGILSGMAYIKRDYLVSAGPYYTQYGPTLRGMNVHFATDSNWKYGIANLMTSLAAKLNLTK